MNKKENTFLANLREKRTFSLVSEQIKTENSESIKSPLNAFSNSHIQLPLLISPNNFDNNKKRFHFKSKKNINDSKWDQNTELELIQRNKSFNFAQNFDLFKENEKQLYSKKKFHFLEDKEDEKKKNEIIMKNEKNLKDTPSNKFNKYLPYLSICNKSLLDLDQSKKSSKFELFSLNKDIGREKNSEVFLTNLEKSGNRDIQKYQGFKLEKIIERSRISSVKEIQISGLKKNDFVSKIKYPQKKTKEILAIKPKISVNYEKIRDENFKNESKRHYEKIQSLMGFAEKMNQIINEQKQKINFLLEDVTTRFDYVLNN